jgi:hypothetical protein
MGRNHAEYRCQSSPLGHLGNRPKDRWRLIWVAVALLVALLVGGVHAMPGGANVLVTQPLVASPLVAQAAVTDETAPAPEETSSPSEASVGQVGQASPTVGNAIDGYPVVLDGQELFRVKVGVEGVTAEERAAILTQRIQAVVADASITPDQIRAETDETQSVVLAGTRYCLPSAQRTKRSTVGPTQSWRPWRWIGSNRRLSPIGKPVAYNGWLPT